LSFSFHLIAVQEFAQLTSGNTVYKLIGPVLVKQDQAEAKSNVNTRLDFIRSEMSGFSPNVTNSELKSQSSSQRVEGQIKDIEQKQEKKKGEVSL
jgi:prefoldin beta subunit